MIKYSASLLISARDNFQLNTIFLVKNITMDLNNLSQVGDGLGISETEFLFHILHFSLNVHFGTYTYPGLQTNVKFYVNVRKLHKEIEKFTKRLDGQL